MLLLAMGTVCAAGAGRLVGVTDGEELSKIFRAARSGDNMPTGRRRLGCTLLPPRRHVAARSGALLRHPSPDSTNASGGRASGWVAPRRFKARELMLLGRTGQRTIRRAVQHSAPGNKRLYLCEISACRISSGVCPLERARLYASRAPIFGSSGARTLPRTGAYAPVDHGERSSATRPQLRLKLRYVSG